MASGVIAVALGLGQPREAGVVLAMAAPGLAFDVAFCRRLPGSG